MKKLSRKRGSTYTLVGGLARGHVRGPSRRYPFEAARFGPHWCRFSSARDNSTRARLELLLYLCYLFVSRPPIELCSFFSSNDSSSALSIFSRLINCSIQEGTFYLFVSFVQHGQATQSFKIAPMYCNPMKECVHLLYAPPAILSFRFHLFLLLYIVCE